MQLYDFHGTIPQNEIGKELRDIVRSSKKDFKVLTGYGATSGVCKSKDAAIKSLRKMKKEGMIKEFLPAEFIPNILWVNDEFYQAKIAYKNRLLKDRDAAVGNAGVIFVFVK